MTDEPKSERRLTSHLFNLVVMLLGGIGLTWMLYSVGISVLTDAIENVGGWFILILALDLAALFCDAAALSAFMRPEARMVPYWRVLTAQASGRAINVLTPTGALGEPTKLSMLVSHGPRNRVLSSLVLLNLGQFYLSVIVIVLGTPIMFLMVDLPHSLKILVLIGFAVLIPLVIALGLLVQRGALSTVVSTIRKVRVISEKRAEAWRTRFAEVDSHIRELQTNRSAGTWKGFLWVGLSKLVQWSATLILLATAGVDVNAALVVGILSVGVLIQWVSQVVPMGLGLADGGNYALFDLVGSAGAYGVVITLLNRARSITIAIIGLGGMLIVNTINRFQGRKMQNRIEALRDKGAVQVLADEAQVRADEAAAAAQSS